VSYAGLIMHPGLGFQVRIHSDFPFKEIKNNQFVGQGKPEAPICPCKHRGLAAVKIGEPGAVCRLAFRHTLVQGFKGKGAQVPLVKIVLDFFVSGSGGQNEIIENGEIIAYVKTDRILPMSAVPVKEAVGENNPE
jgi:hypothetical protein